MTDFTKSRAERCAQERADYDRNRRACNQKPTSSVEFYRDRCRRHDVYITLRRPNRTGLLRATASCVANVLRAPKRKPSLCLCCQRPVCKLDGIVVCVAVPQIDNAEKALGSVICPWCASGPDLHNPAINNYRCIWPVIRGIEVMLGSEAVH